MLCGTADGGNVRVTKDGAAISLELGAQKGI